jgi:hypothetical protein
VLEKTEHVMFYTEYSKYSGVVKSSCSLCKSLRRKSLPQSSSRMSLWHSLLVRLAPLIALLIDYKRHSCTENVIHVCDCKRKYFVRVLSWSEFSCLRPQLRFLSASSWVQKTALLPDMSWSNVIGKANFQRKRNTFTCKPNSLLILN